MIVDVTRTHLELRSPGQFRRTALPHDPAVAFTRITPDVGAYRELYRRIGARWHWHDRDRWSDERLAEYLAYPTVAIWELTVDGESAGFTELERHEDGAVEIVYFGLDDRFFGRRLGARMLADAVDEAWRMNASRVWLHTCTLDSPRALPNYLARGFDPFRQEQYQEQIGVEEDAGA